MTRSDLKRATRGRVLEAASRLFRERGFEATTVRDIADGAGVSVGTVMSLGDKRALLVLTFDTSVAAEHAARRGEQGENNQGSCSDRLVTVVEPFVTLFTERPDLSRSYASILVAGAHSSTLFTDLAVVLVEEFRAAVTAQDCVPPSAAPAVADALYSAYVGTLFTWSALGADDREVLTERLRAVFSAICTCKE